MPEVLREPAPTMYNGLVHEEDYWVNYITSRNIAQNRQEQLSTQHEFVLGQELAWHVDKDRQVQVFGNNGANKNTSQLTQSNLTINQRMGMDDAKYIRSHNIEGDKTARSGAHAVRLLRERKANDHRSHHSRGHKSWGLRGHREPVEQAGLLGIPVARKEARPILGIHTREEVRREQARHTELVH